LREILRVQKLGKNLGGYHGETIDIRKVLTEIELAAKNHGWSSEIFHNVADFKLLALYRAGRAETPGKRVYISTGIHGDEPAGPLAALKLIRENHWPENLEVFLLPCLNPAGFTLNKRENAAGNDLNRDYRNPQTAEIRAQIAWLERQPQFDLCLLLHEDWESGGFYLYETNPGHELPLADKIIAAVEKVCPIERSELIEGRSAKDGIVRPNIDPRSRPDWPEAFYLITNKTRQSYTIEAPSDFPIATRVNALVAAVNAALENLR
jgi:hypothetical protein